MLMLTRRPQEEIRITVGVVVIHVLVSDIHGHQVRIGIDAPPDVIIDREEIALRKDLEAGA